MTPNKEESIKRMVLFRKHSNRTNADYSRGMDERAFNDALSEYSASLFTEEQAKDIYTVGYVDGTGYMSNAIAQAFGAEVTSEELNADKAIEKYRNELADKGK